MRYCVKMTVMACGVAALTACQTTPTHNYLPAEARPHIKTVDSVLIAKQTTVGADIKTSKISQYLQGHIIPILIDVGVNSVRQKKAKGYVSPMREALSTYDYAADIREEFNQALVNSGVEGAGDLKILRQEPQGFRAAFVRKSQADAVMFVDVKYAFTPNFDNLNLTSAVFLYPINPELSPYKERPDKDRVIEYSDNIYRNNFIASIPVPEDSKGDEPSELDEVAARKTSENAALWAQMSEDELIEKLQDAATTLAAHIAADMRVDEPDDTEIEPQEDHDEYLKTEPILMDVSFPEESSAGAL